MHSLPHCHSDYHVNIWMSDDKNWLRATGGLLVECLFNGGCYLLVLIM